MLPRNARWPGLIGQRLFRQDDGRWQHCKTWIARRFFF